jgi:hypothetical protein
MMQFAGARGGSDVHTLAVQSTCVFLKNNRRFFDSPPPN